MQTKISGINNHKIFIDKSFMFVIFSFTLGSLLGIIYSSDSFFADASVTYFFEDCFSIYHPVLIFFFSTSFVGFIFLPVFSFIKGFAITAFPLFSLLYNYEFGIYRLILFVFNTVLIIFYITCSFKNSFLIFASLFGNAVTGDISRFKTNVRVSALYLLAFVILNYFFKFCFR